MDHVVLLHRRHPGLRGHQAETAGDGAIHGERIGAVFELALGETERIGQQYGPILRAVAVRADPLIDRFASFERIFVQSPDEAGVVDPLFVFGQLEGEQGRQRLQFTGSVRRREYRSSSE